MKKDTKIALGVAGGIIATVTLVYVFRKQIKSVFGGYKWFDKSLKWYRDTKTRNIVETLHPKARKDFKEFISKVEKKLGLQVIATSGYRTWAKQAELHRHNPSNATAGNSSHNYGFALDINVLDKNGKNILRKSSSKSQWINSGIVPMAKKMGFKWGGDFSNYHDPIHFYLEPMDRAAMKKRYLAGKKDSKGYVKLA